MRAPAGQGYLSDEIIGRYFGLFYSEAEQLSGVPAKNLEIALRSGQFEGEGWRYRKDGSRFWAHVMIDTIRDEQNTLLGFAKITRDISEQKAINDRIAWMARYDALTGLPNRVEFFERVEKLITGNDARRFAIFTIDLDKFKEINDLQGHLIGDQLLQRVAGAVLKTLQKEEMVAASAAMSLWPLNLFPMRVKWMPLLRAFGTASAVSRRLLRRKWCSPPALASQSTRRTARILIRY